MTAGRVVAGALAGLLLVAAEGACAAQRGIEVADDTGRIVRLKAPARRIVSLAPHLTELLFAAGAGDAIAGTVEWSDHPPAAKRLPRVGDSAQLDLERVVASKPDLIVVWQSGNSAQQLARLATLGVPIYANDAQRLADIASTLRRLGRLAGTETQAEQRTAAFERALDELRTHYAGRRELRVFYQIWHRPLLTINARHMISEALALCGARNVFAQLRPLTPAIGEDAVVAADPDAIVTGSVDPQGPDNLDTWRRLPALRAVRLGNLIVTNPDTLHRQSERVIDGVRELCEKLDAARGRMGVR